MDSSNSTKAFTDAIKKMAAEECKKIDEETRFIKKQRLASEKSNAKDKYKDYIDYELAKIETDKNKQLSFESDKAKKELAFLRGELCEKVFARVRGEIKAFTESAQYKDFLKKSLDEINGVLTDEDTLVYARKEDFEILKSIDKDIKLAEDSGIELGGIKAVGEKSGCLADNTLDMKLLSQREWFLANSDLKI